MTGFDLTGDGSITNSGSVILSAGNGSVIAGLVLNGNGSIASASLAESAGASGVIDGISLNGNGSVSSGTLTQSVGDSGVMEGISVNGNGSISSGTLTQSGGNSSVFSGLNVGGNGSVSSGTFVQSAGNSSVFSGINVDGNGSISSTTFAQSAGNSSVFSGMSVNGDGSVSSGTFTQSAGSSSVFAGIGVNGNGSISSGTFTQSAGSSSVFAGIGINGNGSISSKTFTQSAGASSVFSGISLNGNGSISSGTFTQSAGANSVISGITLNGNGSIMTGNVAVSAGTGSRIQAVTLNGTGSITNNGNVMVAAGAGSDFTAVTINGSNSSLLNTGTIAAFGGTAIALNGNLDSLTNIIGSRIIGAIQLGTNNTVNFAGGNWLLTFSPLDGSIVKTNGTIFNTNGAPFAVNGNSVAVLDPTALALADRSVMNFTGGISSMLQDRFRGMPVSGGAMGFAPDLTARIDAAQSAFSGIPSVSMSYSSDSRSLNANAMYTKAPVAAVPLYDTVVWASGFGGERQQQANGNILRATDDAYGGAMGIDRLVSPDLRVGVFAGAGSGKLNTAFNVQNVNTDYVFGGGYARWDKTNYYVDFALFGGSLSNNSTRQIANNNVATGLEIATASYGGWYVSPDVTFGYRIFANDSVFTPKLRVRYVGGTIDGYTEAGSAQGLTMGNRDLSDLEERLGVEFSNVRPVSFGGTLKASVEISGVGLQRLGDNTINTILLSQNLAFTTPGTGSAYGGAANVGLDWRPRSNISVFTSAEATAMSDKSFSIAGKGGIRVGF